MNSILVVDDDADILMAIRAVLEMDGFLVLDTQRGDRVLEILENATPDLILMDIMLAGVDGREICKQLKTHPAYAHIPVVLFSASTLSFSEVMAFGANDFLSKPFDLQGLLAKVRTYLKTA